ncbi:MAG: YeeE/YedE thiosulfate transporter family protein [Bacteroidota bacterium]|nr:YeeE/YedE thiosulfate transporter family protein [Bacteroidota bacterium]
MKNLEERSKQYLNPYFGGVLLGLLLLLTVYITGRGLGATGAVKSSIVTAVDLVAPTYAEKQAYYSKFLSDDHHPMSNWLVFETIGIFLGAFLSGLIAGRVKKFRIEHSPKITPKTRLIFATLGGMLFGIGSQFGRGCTSGAALSGTATMATAGFLAMMLIFGSGYLFAYFFRKLWI